MGRFHGRPCHGIVNTTAGIRYFAAWGVNQFLLRVIHQHHAFIDTLRDNRAGDDGPIAVKDFEPVIILHADFLRIRFTNPDNRSAAGERQHVQIVCIGGVNAPFLVWGNEIQQDCR